MALFDPMIDIALATIAIALISRALQSKFVDRKKMKQQQADMKEKQKKVKELMQKTDQKSRLEMEKLQKEMLESMSESMQGSMRYMMISLPLFLGFFWVLGTAYEGALISLPFAVPIIHRNMSFEITASISWLWWYIYSMFAISIMINLALKAWDKSKEARK